MKSSDAQPKSTETSPELVTLQEASSILKCHPNTLRQWDKRGILKAVRFGQRRDRRYKKEDILNIVNNGRNYTHHIMKPERHFSE